MKNGLIEYFVGNPVAARLLMVFLILGGIIAGLNVHVRQIPDLDFRTIVVTLASPGSSPRKSRKTSTAASKRACWDSRGWTGW